MANPVNAEAGCFLVGEYVDEAELPANQTFHNGEVVRPHVVAEFRDHYGITEALREFTVLFKDGRVVAVRGHGLKYSPHVVAGEDLYSVVIRDSGEEVQIALFKSAEVAGIFHGEMRLDRKIA